MLRRNLQLLPKSSLIVTGPVDRANWNYRTALGRLQMQRFHLIRDLIGDSKFPHLLEFGYGSGIFMPELSRCCNELSGVDIHEHFDAVTDMLHKQGVRATLRQGSASTIPFESGSFDAVVAVSVLELVDNIDATCDEIGRVLKSDGFLFVVTPGNTWVLDLGLRLLTGTSATEFGNRRQRVLPALTRRFSILQQLTFPSVPTFGVKVYTALKMGA